MIKNLKNNCTNIKKFVNLPSMTRQTGLWGLAFLFCNASSRTLSTTAVLPRPATSCNQVLFIWTTREPSVNRKNLRAPTLVEPTWLYQESGPPSCTTPQQPTICIRPSTSCIKIAKTIFMFGKYCPGANTNKLCSP